MTPLTAGDPAPDFTLPADGGEEIRLADLRGRKVVIYFYPKDDTTGCTAQACGFRDAHGDFAGKNAVVLGISPDPVKSHDKFKAKYDLPFRLLSDPEHKVAEQYGVWTEKSMYGRKYMGIERSHFVIGEDGRLIEVARKVKPADSVKSALVAVG